MAEGKWVKKPTKLYEAGGGGGGVRATARKSKFVKYTNNR